MLSDNLGITSSIFDMHFYFPMASLKQMETNQDFSSSKDYSALSAVPAMQMEKQLKAFRSMITLMVLAGMVV